MANANVRPTAGALRQNGEGATQLIKPVDWTIYMIDAVLQVVSDSSLPLVYPSENEGKLLILKNLNFHEAHDDYVWPDFTSLGFDFANNMRLRRALVHDVYVALEKSGRLHVGPQQVVTPSRSSQRSGKRAVPGGSMTQVRRCVKKCKTRYSDDDDDDVLDAGDALFCHNTIFLARTMNHLIDRSGTGAEAYLGCVKPPSALADIVHDGLVEVWERPQAVTGMVSHTLAQKAHAWAALAETQADKTNSDKDSTISVLENFRKQQGRGTSIELGESNRRSSIELGDSSCQHDSVP